MTIRFDQCILRMPINEGFIIYYGNKQEICNIWKLQLHALDTRGQYLAS